VAQLGELAAAEMSASAGFQCNDASWMLAEKYQNLRLSQCLTQRRSAGAVNSVNLTYNLRQIETHCDTLRQDRSPLWIIADPPWHMDAVAGRLHHQSPFSPSFQLFENRVLREFNGQEAK